MTESEDPRLDISAEDAAFPDLSQPVVGRAGRRSSGFMIAATFAALAIALFVLLNSRRDAQGSPSLVTPPAFAAEPAPPPPLQLGPLPAPPRAAPVARPSIPHVARPPAPPPQIEVKPAPSPDPLQRRRAPSLVVDLGSVSGEPLRTGISSARARSVALEALVSVPTQAPIQPMAGAGVPSTGAISLAADSGGLALTAGAAGRALDPAAPIGGGTEQFARRVGEEEPGQARATELPNLESLIAQGTVIPGVLETAIDSDLPGFTRAVVSRDVRNFDGTAILIPRGSRLIGQYKSAVALGQTRAFIIWTRIIRPDGASILIGSPGGDALGRGGLNGKVDSHFFERFGGSILLSVLNAGIAAIGGVPSTQVTIGSPGAAIGAASSIVNGDAIPPTVKVPQGATIRIFVARDLDFSAVGPAK